MVAKEYDSDRKRSRPVTKKKRSDVLKKYKLSTFFVIMIILILVLSSIFVVYYPDNDNDDEDSNETVISEYGSDPKYIAALENTIYPVAVLETSKGAIAIELYTDIAPDTCQNFISLVNQNFYDGMIFHRIMNNFMIQGGNTMPDGSTKTSPYGNIVTFEGNGVHEDGVISMASTGAKVPGGAQFFIMDGARVGEQFGMDGNYAAFGKTIYGIEVVRDIADDNHDSSYEPSPGGGKPITDIIINKIKIVNQ